MSSRPFDGGTGRPVSMPPALTLRALVVLTFLAALGSQAVAQDAGSTLGEAASGGELESYLRTLQVAGKSAPYPWSIRGFSVPEVDRLAPRDSVHPWAARYDFRSGAGRGEIHLHPVHTRAVYNSAFPHGGNDGAVWAGRGLTTAVEAGVTARYRWLTLTLAPIAFRAENADFDLQQHELSPEVPYADWRRPKQIDLPQRFGDGAYTRIDPGQSTLRADVGGVALGLSTANQYWGPAAEYPLVQGNNAPGFVHGFMGTSRPVNLWIGRVHGRAFWGRLEQSPYASTSPDSAVRFGTGVVAVFTPRGLPGLELGASRFFHLPWPEGGIGGEEIFKPLETFFKANLYSVIVDGDTVESSGSVASNQLAALFARWVFPESGLELYGELATEDHRHNLRDWFLEPDHNTAYTLGFRKVWMRDDRHLWAFRGELLNAEPSHLDRTRFQAPFYVHAWARQGHTSRGQILGSPAAYGGAASVVAADYYHPGGRFTGFWKREVRQERGEFLLTGEAEQPDVMQSLGAEALLFSGRWELFGAMEGVYDFNRNFSSDVANLSATLGLRARL
ncbi:MAG TPA: capsule assembly Wzi family protein [Longimicrobiaceae bacterium]|nr:capsule assembly Wzi family protein [Longimicrobiaceae bacterium]